jgi:hypothetical protein
MSEKPLTQRETNTLAEIYLRKGKFLIWWAPKTREKLENRGYVRVSGEHVKMTPKGIDALKRLAGENE